MAHPPPNNWRDRLPRPPIGGGIRVAGGAALAKPGEELVPPRERLPASSFLALSARAMASLADLECIVDGVKPPICTSSFLFRCELNSSTRSYTFKVSEEDDSDHILALNMICLSEGAKDECNIVEFVGQDYQDQEIVVPVANLKLSCQPSLCLKDFQLQPPVTFRLRSGSGPVHLAGQHQIFHKKDLSEDEFSGDEEDFSEEDESMEEEEELSPIKPAKKQRRS